MPDNDIIRHATTVRKLFAKKVARPARTAVSCPTVSRLIRRIVAPHGWIIRRDDGHGWHGPDAHRGNRFGAYPYLWHRFGTVSAARAAAVWHGYDDARYRVERAPSRH